MSGRTIATILTVAQHRCSNVRSWACNVHPLDQIESVVVEDGGTVKKSRAGKVVLLGPIGLLARSTQGTVALTVHGKDSAHVFYEVIKMNAAEVRGKLSKALTDAGIAVLAEEPTQAHAASVPDELAKLAALREQGILTDAEFAGQKNKLLAS